MADTQTDGQLTHFLLHHAGGLELVHHPGKLVGGVVAARCRDVVTAVVESRVQTQHLDCAAHIVGIISA